MPFTFIRFTSGKALSFAYFAKFLILITFESVSSTPFSAPSKIIVATEMPPTLAIPVLTSLAKFLLSST